MCAVASLHVPASAQTASEEGASKRQTMICLPDATGTGWQCAPEGELAAPQRKSPTRAAQQETPAQTQPQVDAERPQEASAGQPEELDPGLDPLTGLSADPADWFIESPAKPSDAEHSLSEDVAGRYYVRVDDGDGFCPGRYEVRDYPYPRTVDDADYPIIAEADVLSSIVDRSADLDGNVTIEQGNRLLFAPSAQLDQESRVVTFTEGVRLDQPGLVMQGQTAEVDLTDKSADLANVQFLLTDAGYRGTASKLQQSGEGDLDLTSSAFTSCEPGNNGWRLSASTLVIENEEVFGTAKHAVVRLKSVPVFYSPYLKFPVSDERVSGFLFPNLSHSDEDGVDVSIPYYLNLAPNYDATITPRVIGERGVGAEVEFRHMNSWQNTVIGGAFLPEDDLFNGSLDRKDWREQGGAAVFGEFEPADRWLGGVTHDGQLGPFRTLVDYTAVSDRDYFRDLGSDLDFSARRELQRKGEIQYARGGFFARVWAQRFQRLDEVFVPEYERLPELEMQYSRNLVGPLELNIGGKWSEFDRETEGLNGLAAVTGSRMHVEPRLRVPFSWPFGFLTFGAGYRYTEYDLEQDSEALGFQLTEDNPDRGIGLGYVDGGLFFERDLALFGEPLIQTLEPRIYYLYQEFDEQSELPRFDASSLTFTYNQLYRDNRFSGLDRFGDANQVSAGVTTRFISAANGREFFRASVGEIYYFEDRRVRLSGTNQTANELQSTSAIAGEVSARIRGGWYAYGNVVWDPHDNEVDQGGGGIGYRRDNRHIINLGFRNNRLSDLEQTDISIYWPISKSFAILGRWNYDLISGRTIEGFGGLEYNDCCLQVRLMARRFLDSRTNSFAEVEADEGIFLQIVFKGLAGFGTKVESVLERGIRGYRSPEAFNYFSN